MILIEKEGKINYHKVKCDNCNSILKYLAEDQKEAYNPGGYFGSEFFYYIICPVCKKKVYTLVFCDEQTFDYRIKQQEG